jgi:hypothetical protein
MSPWFPTRRLMVGALALASDRSAGSRQARVMSRCPRTWRLARRGDARRASRSRRADLFYSRALGASSAHALVPQQLHSRLLRYRSPRMLHSGKDINGISKHGDCAMEETTYSHSYSHPPGSKPISLPTSRNARTQLTCHWGHDSPNRRDKVDSRRGRSFSSEYKVAIDASLRPLLNTLLPVRYKFCVLRCMACLWMYSDPFIACIIRRE